MTYSSQVAKDVHKDEHDAFCASRCDEYVYIPTDSRFFTALDKHADSVEKDIKRPFVLLGRGGIGKSAMLANWILGREKKPNQDQFIFKHFVTSSAQSHQLSNMLYRLELSLKSHFHLREMEIAETEDSLRWSLLRYLEAAAKKATPSNLIIVIDGVNALKSETCADGSLHWLPTELPNNVRVILSTLITRPNDGSGCLEPSRGEIIRDDENREMATTSEDRTYIELRRRQCSFLTVEPLGMDVRHQIINCFWERHFYPQCTNRSDHGLNESQLDRLITAKATAQPLFLRMLLYGLKVGLLYTGTSIDDQLECYLVEQGSVNDLICGIFDMIENYVKSKVAEGRDILGPVLTSIYASRNGLSDEEIRGVIELDLGQRILPASLDMTLSLLKDLTMVVNGLRSFSHAVFRRVVYDKYIRCSKTHLRQHELMARYFSNFQSSERKLFCLAYHLEVSGAWSKLKSALVDIHNFKLWWSTVHKKEFINIWASLTDRKDPSIYQQKLVTGEFDSSTMQFQTQRPCYDVVDEYVHSLEQYREKFHSKDESIGEITLSIADFLLEFAMLRHEETADVPAFLHPLLPNEDMKAIGVPHLSIDQEGTAYYFRPSSAVAGDQQISSSIKSTFGDFPTRQNEAAFTICAYFFYRWLWIQFPYLAVANCVGQQSSTEPPVWNKDSLRNVEKQHGKEVAKDVEIRTGDVVKEEAAIVDRDSSHDGYPDLDAGMDPSPLKVPIAHSLMKMAVQPLPQLALRKPTRLVRQDVLVNGSERDEITGAMDKVAKEICNDLKQYRYEYDMLVQQRGIYEKKVADLSNELMDLTRIHSGSIEILDQLRQGRDKAFKHEKMFGRLRAQNQNFLTVLLMCERHPPSHPVLIEELENKIKEDNRLISEIKNSSWEETFEYNVYQVNYAKLRSVIQESLSLQNQLLASRYRLRENLAATAEINFRILSHSAVYSPPIKNASSKQYQQASQPSFVAYRDTSRQVSRTPQHEAQLHDWQKRHSLIYAKTGISQIDLFFQKFRNCEILEKQMTDMKSIAERRLYELRSEQQLLEKELYYLEGPGPVSSDAASPPDEERRLLESQLREAYEDYKRIRDRVLIATNLQENLANVSKAVTKKLDIYTRPSFL